MSRQEYDSYQRKDYGPGYGGTGRAEKDQFSIDGKTWAYRDPYNQSMINSQNRGDDERTTINEHSYQMTNALYDYDYGTVRDAAQHLGIGNVNDKEEVASLLKYIQEGPEQGDTATPEAPKTPDTPKEMKDITLSQQAQQNQDIVNQWESQGADQYGVKDSVFKGYTGSKAVFNSGNTQQNAQQAAETNNEGEPRDNQEGAQNFMNGYKDSLKKTMNFTKDF